MDLEICRLWSRNFHKLSGPTLVTYLNGTLYLSGVCLGVDLRTRDRISCTEFDNYSSLLVHVIMGWGGNMKFYD
jgi:hypothetical protein